MGGAARQRHAKGNRPVSAGGAGQQGRGGVESLGLLWGVEGALTAHHYVNSFLCV